MEQILQLSKAEQLKILGSDQKKKRLKVMIDLNESWLIPDSSTKEIKVSSKVYASVLMKLKSMDKKFKEYFDKEKDQLKGGLNFEPLLFHLIKDVLSRKFEYLNYYEYKTINYEVKSKTPEYLIQNIFPPFDSNLISFVREDKYKKCLTIDQPKLKVLVDNVFRAAKYVTYYMEKLDLSYQVKIAKLVRDYEKNMRPIQEKKKLPSDREVLFEAINRIESYLSSKADVRVNTVSIIKELEKNYLPITNIQ